MLVLLTLVDINELSLGVASIVLTGTVDVVLTVSEELDPVGDPASNSGDGEEHGEHIGGEAHGAVDEATVEVNVGVEFAADAESTNRYKYSSSRAIFSSSMAISIKGSFPQI